MKAAPKSFVLSQRNIATLHDFLSRVQQPDVVQFIHYMLSIHPAERLPSRRMFDPLDIPGLPAAWRSPLWSATVRGSDCV